MTTPIQIKHRRDTAANWTAANPILGASELGYETDTKKFKFGDGTTAWNSLAYFEAGAGDVVGPATATDNAIARFDQGTGDLIQNSLMTVDDAGSPNIPSGQTYDINGTPHDHGLTGDVTYYVDPASGDDDDAGDLAHPFATVAHALSLIPKNLGGYVADIYLVGNTSETVTIAGYYSGALFLIGFNGADSTRLDGGLYIENCTCDIDLMELWFHVADNDSYLFYVYNSDIYAEFLKFSKVSGKTGTMGAQIEVNANVMFEGCENRGGGYDPVDYGVIAEVNSYIGFDDWTAAHFIPGTYLIDPASEFWIRDGDRILRTTGAVTDNAISRFDGTSGNVAQNSLVTIDDSGSVNIPSGQSYNINGAAHTHTITDSVYLRAAEALSRGTNGAAYTAPIEASTNHEIYVALDFDKDTDEFAVWTLDLPTGWNAGTVTFLPKWTATGGSGTVCWSIRGVCIGDNVAIDTAFGTAVTSTDTLQNADRVHIGPETAAMTFAGTVAAGKWLAVEVSRDVSEDTLGQDARLLGLTMKFTRVV